MLHGTKLEAFWGEPLEKLDSLWVSPAGQSPRQESLDATGASLVPLRPVGMAQALLLALRGHGYW